MSEATNALSRDQERPKDRRRRIADAARFLPIAAAALWAVPVLWPHPQDPAAPVESVPMSDAMLYVFGVWAAVIALAALFGRWSRDWMSDAPSEQAGHGGRSKAGSG